MDYCPSNDLQTNIHRMKYTNYDDYIKHVQEYKKKVKCQILKCIKTPNTIRIIH